MQQLIHRHDLEVEKMVIASLIFNPDEIGKPHGTFPLEAFYGENNRKLYVSMLRVHRETGCADARLIAEDARVHGFEQAPLYLYGLLVEGDVGGNPTFHSGYLPGYAARLLSLYADRERGRASLIYQQAIHDGQDEAEARIILDATLDALESLTPELSSDEDVLDGIGSAARYPSGYRRIDDVGGGLTKPGLNILAARPSVGKSALMRGIIRAAAKRGDTVFWYSLDQARGQIYELEIAHLLREDTTWARAATREQLLDAVRRIRAEVWHDRVMLIDKPLSLSTLLSHARMSGADLVCIDYLQVVDTGTKNQSEYETVTTVSKALKALALEMGVPVLALSQFGRELGDNEVPSLRHLKNSGQIEQDADQVWGLQRDLSLNSSESQEATLHILKNKTGGTGKLLLTWVGRFAAYEPYQSEPGSTSNTRSR